MTRQCLLRRFGNASGEGGEGGRVIDLMCERVRTRARRILAGHRHNFNAVMGCLCGLRACPQGRAEVKDSVTE